MRRLALGIGAVAAFAGVYGLYRVFVTTATGQQIEHVALTGSERGRSRLWETAGPILDTISLPVIGAILVIATVVALVRKRWFDAGFVFLAVGGATATTQLLKRLLDRPDTGLPWTGPNSFPSGHTTMAAALTAALLFIAPERWRGVLAAAGAFFTTAIGTSTLVGAWHRPSDVVGAIFVAAGWYLLVRAFQPAVHAPPPAEFDSDTAEYPTVDPASVRPSSDDDNPFRPGRAIVVTLFGFAIVGAAVAAVTLFMTSQNTVRPSPGDYLLAYGGGVAGVLATASFAFAIMAVAVPRHQRWIPPEPAPVSADDAEPV